MKVSLSNAHKYAKKLNINLNKIGGIKMWKYAMEVELEHGKKFPKTNVTNDNLLMTSKIAAAHLNEFPDYYQRLKKMEKDAVKYWEMKRKTFKSRTKRRTNRRTKRRTNRRTKRRMN
jgi:hypothetical protein